MLAKILFHPPLVHFPIAFYFLELALLTFWIFKQDAAFLRFARFSFRIGYFVMIPTMIAGWIDAGGFVPSVRVHASFAFSVFVLYTARFVCWQIGKPEQVNYRKIQLAGAILGVALVTVTAFFGSDLVYGK